jgi:hypothetical protein
MYEQYIFFFINAIKKEYEKHMLLKHHVFFTCKNDTYQPYI